MQQCHNICDREEYTVKVAAYRTGGQSPYCVEGVKFCSTCSVYLQTGNEFMNKCPCCHTNLRNGARSRKQRMKIKK